MPVPSPMRLAVTHEGRSIIYIPSPEYAVASGRLEPAWLEVFYNPAMEFNRDVSVVAASALRRTGLLTRSGVAFDAHAGVGVRGVRYAVEAGYVKVIMNDINPKASMLAALNARANGLEPGSYMIFNKESNSLMFHLSRERPTPVSLIDIDPYGSPAPFVDAALALSGKGTVVAMTATDLAVLEGGKARAAVRRYMLRSVSKTPVSKETGLRVLLGYVARVAAAHDKAVKPLLAYYADHYYRVYVAVERGARRSDSMLEENLGRLVYCPETGVALALSYAEDPASACGGSYVVAADPAWIGSLGDQAFLEAMLNIAVEAVWLGTRPRVEKLLNTLHGEAPLSPRSIYVSLTSVASKARVNTPKKSKVVELLRSMGYRAVATHFSGEGVRTDAPWGEVLEAVVKLGSSG
ncbi:N(2),N(2)-dimethylguanosine tRNA methyltransferase [Aeropyrum pernix K1]|uniref:tRNA (guanine(26)-N(2))-dimethyltransferase n=1 Tax=Aeropyrum pernix (strain ATCC 700893 / DSM 11879 / JCM 9820 / NBRC 100138 / K1) TaxID=272557 RepID=TRM1_AERPE|nr:RecName: Full=tRNA (guanine(26)-N(2))-dimethyltransferase; AltName: Full=tRNA 2,2-dimethylguanosine-26 methyltransferase; AltName: Full=tRNA(guanine-26,N(2)-N(2)) methyltransferase; AltName: Full=tRNA(m(2,2)G26)dimethyltransferase [Aeropyrum pernix K1]BAA79760.2 N(2),N(2)-dimethylguanosine tRNA methyltransferase [Aeropyrum pernix K1]